MRLVTVIVLIMTAALISCGKSLPQLHVYSWADYVKPQLIERFEKEYNCRVIVDTFDSNEAMFAKLKAGATGYDIIIPSGYYVELMEKQQLLHPIDTQLIPNLKYIDADHPIFSQRKPSYKYSVPYMIGYTVLAYRNDKVKDPEATWNMYARQDLHGRMTMLNDIRDAISAGLKYLGYSANSTNEAEINAAADQVIKWKKNLAKFESEQYKNGIASAEYLLVQGYSGDVIQVMQENKKVSMMFPREGTTMYCDYLVIPTTAKQVELAHAFINFLQNPEVAAENMLSLSFVAPNYEAYKLLPQDVLDNPGYFPPKDILEKSESVRDLGPAILIYNKAWDRIKETR